MMFLIALISVALAADCTGVDFVKGGNTCAGVCNSCAATDYQCLSAVGVGYCDADAETTSKYFLMTGAGLAVIHGDDTSYLTDNTKMTIINSVTDGWSVRENGDDYAFSNTGVVLGNDEMGGGIGITSYLAKNTITTNKNKVYFKADGELKLSDGACISEITDGECGEARTWGAGDYKFNAYGWTSGTNFQIPDGGKYLGFRTKLQVVGAEVTALTVNGKSVADNGGDDVSNLSLTFSDVKAASIDFPTKYNIGTVDTTTKTATFTETKTVKIKAHSLNTEEQSIIIDYLFDITDLSEAGKCFIYDPTVKTASSAEDLPTTTTADSGSATAGAIAASLAAFLWFLM